MRDALQRARTVTVAALVALSVTLTSGGTTAAASSSSHPTAIGMPTAKAIQKTASTAEELEDGLRFIESIPDEALKNDAAWERWRGRHPVPRDRVNALACGSAIAVAIASNAFAPAKILKIKTAIKAAGGAKRVAGLAVDAFKKARVEGKPAAAAIAAAQDAVVKNGGGAAQGVLLEFFSLSSVMTSCFA